MNKETFEIMGFKEFDRLVSIYEDRTSFLETQHIQDGNDSDDEANIEEGHQIILIDDENTDSSMQPNSENSFTYPRHEMSKMIDGFYNTCKAIYEDSLGSKDIVGGYFDIQAARLVCLFSFFSIILLPFHLSIILYDVQRQKSQIKMLKLFLNR